MIRRLRLARAALLGLVVVPAVLSATLAARAQPVVSSEGASGGPRIVLSADAETGQRQIRMDGPGAVYPTIDVACDGQRWTMPLRRSQDGGTYDVPGKIVEVMLNAIECRLFLPDQELVLARQQLWTAWAGPARSGAAPQILIGQVIEVIDGNTILVNLGDRAETVRYIGINAKETVQPTRGVEGSAGETADANRQLVARQQIRLELDAQERDREGRLLAYVYVAGRMVNAELVRRGSAEVMTIQPNVRHRELFVTLEQEARDQRRGLWADPSEPTTPQSLPQAARSGSEGRSGVAPDGAGACPAPQPIKGQFTAYTTGRCVYHLPEGESYGRTKPERCYATVEEARQDGCVASRR